MTHRTPKAAFPKAAFFMVPYYIYRFSKQLAAHVGRAVRISMRPFCGIPAINPRKFALLC